ncbi:MAG: HAD-IC family P-type ATPase, partial [Planctomycetia bacterium]
MKTEATPRTAASSAPDAPDQAAPWHAMTAADAMERWETTDWGLGAAEAERRRAKFGANELPRPKPPGVWKILVGQVANPLVYVLIGAGFLAVALGEALNAVVVFGVVILNTLVGFVQEYRAGKAVAGLLELAAHDALVQRDGARSTRPAVDLVPGDLVFLQPGDKTPADLRLVSAKGLRIEEAALTGESAPADKQVAAVAPEAGLGDRVCMAFAGTMVVAGTATGLVVATGRNTQVGRVTDLVNSAVELETPLTKSLRKVADLLTIIVVVVSAALFGVALWRGYTVVDALLAALALAVAAIPEGLPAIVT